MTGGEEKDVRRDEHIAQDVGTAWQQVCVADGPSVRIVDVVWPVAAAADDVSTQWPLCVVTPVNCVLPAPVYSVFIFAYRLPEKPV